MKTKMFVVLLLLLWFFMTPKADAEGMHKIFLPIINNGDRAKAGIAFSSHVDAYVRIPLLGDSVSHWRGWRNNGNVGTRWGLENTPSLHTDLYWQWRPGIQNWRLESQFHILDNLGADYDGYLLFVNEPDLKTELHPIRMAQLYLHVKHFMPNVKLVGPGLSHRDYQAGFSWFNAWYEAVVRISGVPPDMYAWDIHNYMATEPPLAPYDALEALLLTKGVENSRFWVSEWGADNPERLLEMKRAFDNDPRILRHNWYDQYAAWWDGDDRRLHLFSGGLEGPGAIRLSDLGYAFVYDRLKPTAQYEDKERPIFD